MKKFKVGDTVTFSDKTLLYSLVDLFRESTYMELIVVKGRDMDCLQMNQS